MHGGALSGGHLPMLLSCLMVGNVDLAPRGSLRGGVRTERIPEDWAVLAAVQRPISLNCITVPAGRPRTARTSTIFIWLVPAQMKYSSTSSAITRATSRCIRHSRNTSALTNRAFGGVGQERSVLCAVWCRGIQAGQSSRGCPLLRHRPLRLGNTCTRDR